MPWAKATLRGQRVLARVDERGAFVAEGGRVEIRYRPTDARAYRASASNLERVASEPILPDDACVPEAPSADAAGTAKKSTTAKRGSSKKTGGKAKAAASEIAVPKDSWIAYADGACSGNPGPCGLGLVLISPEGARTELYEYLGEGTNNVAELAAVLRAIEGAPDDERALVIHTDSQYSIGVLTKGWKAKANQTLILDVKRALAKRTGVRLVYVPGHAGVPLNERADELAREAVRTRDTKRETFKVRQPTT